MSRPERRVADQPAVAVEHRDLNLNRLACDQRAGKDCGRGVPAGARHLIAERHAFSLGVGEGFGGGVGPEDALAKRARAAGLLGKTGQRAEIDGAAARMKVEQTLGERMYGADYRYESR